MPYQMEFWPPEQPPPPVPLVGEDLGAEQRAPLIAVLVRMIAKAVDPKRTHETEEESHE